MKIFLALFFLLSVAASSAGAVLDENRFGLFYDQAATIDEIDIEANSQQVLYLVLVNPVSDQGNVQLVGGFECTVVPASGDFLLGVTFPIDAVNVGSTDELIVGYQQGIPVGTGNGTTLATLSVLTMGNNPEGYFLLPTSTPYLPNLMVYLDMASGVGEAVGTLPVGGSFERPVFTFGDYTVDENREWGDVKSLYR